MTLSDVVDAVYNIVRTSKVIWFRVQGLGFRVYDLGFRVWGL